MFATGFFNFEWDPMDVAIRAHRLLAQIADPDEADDEFVASEPAEAGLRDVA